MEQAILALWFFLPVGIANSAPVFAKAIPSLKALEYPMDFHQMFRSKRVFGSHKTFRGLFAGIIVSISVVLFQQYIYTQSSWIRQMIEIDYTQINPVLFGTLCALGALLGDAIESFFKRQIGVKPGKTWFPFDQLDYIIGGMFFTALYRLLPVTVYLWIIIIWFGMHLLFTWLGYVVGLKDSPI
jgi:CDP-2,3-bis-(O-geranylgeranyl)-sn-glycerol synthase